MNNIKLKEVYSLYEKGEYEKALLLNTEILEVEPNNMYAKRYASLLESKNKGNTKKEIPKVKGKQLKCPHCESKISFSSLTEFQQNNIKGGNYNNVELKCPYCHTQFVLQKKTAKSIIGLKVGEKVNLEGKEYRITGYVQYSGKWIEGKYTGSMSYLEWILLGKDNSYKYFSEGFFNDDGERKFEFEFSEKFIPKGKIDLTNYKEKNELVVKSVYGENSKSFKIGENIEILDFGDYVLEKELNGRQMEAGFYKGTKVSKSKAVKIFGKDKDGDKFNNSKIGIKFNLILFGLIIGPLLTFLIFKPIFSLFIEKDKINITDVGDVGNYEIRYKTSTKKSTSRTSYDYGGVKTYYTDNLGIKFSIETKKDQEIIDKIISEGEEKGGDIKRLLNGDTYKLK